MKFLGSLLLGGLLSLMVLIGLHIWAQPRALADALPARAAVPASLAAASDVTVTVGPASLTFTPTVQVVTVGDTVNWVWASSFHSTTSGSCSGFTCTPDGKWDSGVQNVPFTYPVTFTTTGAFPYYCTIHGASGMTGTVIVVQPQLYLPLVVR